MSLLSIRNMSIGVTTGPMPKVCPKVYHMYLMHFGLRDSLQNGIKWEKLVDNPVQNDAAPF